MSYSWKDVAEGWCVPLRDFVGCEEAALPSFDPFERLTAENQSFSVDPFAVVRFTDLPGYSAHLLKSRLPEARLSSVLVNQGVRVGYVTRQAAGCDVICLAPELHGKGLASRLLAATRQLRATLKILPVGDLRAASKQLFCGGSYSKAGLAATRSAHRAAVKRALEAGKPVPSEVLADYPEFCEVLSAAY
jgi:GNAT superfamily N-acetyltransferase